MQRLSAVDDHPYLFGAYPHLYQIFSRRSRHRYAGLRQHPIHSAGKSAYQRLTPDRRNRKSAVPGVYPNRHPGKPCGDPSAETPMAIDNIRVQAAQFPPYRKNAPYPKGGVSTSLYLPHGNTNGGKLRAKTTFFGQQYYAFKIPPVGMPEAIDQQNSRPSYIGVADDLCNFHFPTSFSLDAVILPEKSRKHTGNGSKIIVAKQIKFFHDLQTSSTQKGAVSN